MYLRAQSAESGPPLGTVLGNMGLNAAKFVKDFNDYTKELPAYFQLQVDIHVNEDKSFEFKVHLPAVGYLLGLLRKERTTTVNGKPKKIPCVAIQDLVELAQFRLPGEPLAAAVSMICGTAISANLEIVDEETLKASEGAP